MEYKGDLEQIKAREQAATPGSWYWDKHNLLTDDELHLVMKPYFDDDKYEIKTCIMPGDKEFIARARQDIPALIKRVETLETSLDAYASAARVIALHLHPFCDHELPYAEMIADAARKAGKKINKVREENEAFTREKGSRNEPELLNQIEELKEDFIDFACSGVRNFAKYCGNRTSSCVDGQGWCINKTDGGCTGFVPKAYREPNRIKEKQNDCT